MPDSECVQFLQWALPRLRMRWAGFRKVRGQVCKRLRRRLAALELADLDAYRHYLDRRPAEWDVVDRLCRITISRFYRDRKVFDLLVQTVLPDLAAEAAAEGQDVLRCWCVGCAAGEEPYTLALIWDLTLASRFAALDFRILATDASTTMLTRAAEARFAPSSLKDLPERWRDRAFVRRGRVFELMPRHRRRIRFERHDVRGQPPVGPFRLCLCRNLVFTYFEPAYQKELLGRMLTVLQPGGVLVIGVHESLPDPTAGLTVLPQSRCIVQLQA